MAAWIGLPPRQFSSGDNSRMGGISKRGDTTLRKLFIHGARSVVNTCEGKDDKLNLWVQELLKTKHYNIVVVAVANKLARIAWAILAKKEAFDVDKLIVS